ETSVPFETLKAVVDVAVEIGREGREGKAVGTLIVVGDARHVIARTRQLGFDPFKGYKRKERNVRDFRVREAIKEIAQLDGAFIVARDGTVEAACRLIDAPMAGLTLPKGLGTRHWAAAAITEITKAVAVVVSQSHRPGRPLQDAADLPPLPPPRPPGPRPAPGRGGAPKAARPPGDKPARDWISRYFRFKYARAQRDPARAARFRKGKSVDGLVHISIRRADLPPDLWFAAFRAHLRL